MRRTFPVAGSPQAEDQFAEMGDPQDQPIERVSEFGESTPAPDELPKLEALQRQLDELQAD